MDDFYHFGAPFPVLMKVRIRNNELWIDAEEQKKSDFPDRFASLAGALKQLYKIGPLPNVDLLISLEDGVFWDYSSGTIPLFDQSKEKGSCAVLIPDFEALREAYQVLRNKDITSYAPRWNKKVPRLIWRGSTAQQGWRVALTDKTHSRFSRVSLCELSQGYPNLINARFTLFVQGGESVPSLQKYKGAKMSYEKQFKYKYQILIDGNVSSYTCSGWRFLSNSVVFIPDSPWIQWYFAALQPNIDYIPVNSDLSDLPEKIKWMIDHDDLAQNIAINARKFALTHITRPVCLQYLYYLIWKYSELDFID